MTKRALAGGFVVASLVAFGSLGGGCIDGGVEIGSDDEALVVSPPPSTPTEPGEVCATYCAAAEAVDCPGGEGDCGTICEAFRAESPSCHEEGDAFLLCAATVINPETCDYAIRDGGPDCISLIEEYNDCTRRDDDGIRVALEDVCAPGISISLVGDAYVSDPVSCDVFLFEEDVWASCASGGLCDCYVDGEIVHSCTNLVQTIDFSQPFAGCCGEFFAGHLTDD